MTPPARLAAAAAILDRILAGTPAERALTNWARGARYAGSGDRAAVRDLVYDALRRRRSAAWVGGAETGRGLLLGLLRMDGDDPSGLMSGARHALAPPAPDEAGRDLPEAPRPVRMDLPDWLVPLFDRSLGADAETVAEALRHRAPLTLRANLLRGTPEDAEASLAAEGVRTEPHPTVRTALRVVGRFRALTATRAFRRGLIELQDASSQAAVLRLPLRDGQRVLDLCAGGGGKTLAMGALARVALHAHDADPARMADLPARAERAGIRVRQVADPQTQAAYDLVLVDAPCSGAGTWRRTPDAKWRLTPQRLAALVSIQDDLLDQAAALVAPEGWLAFATCSVLAEEGPDRIAAFLRRSPGWVAQDEMRCLPDADGDGFYQMILRSPGHNRRLQGSISPTSDP
jgi:16S rRNA (cytosine967-C5)-methyltransferase